MSEKQLPASALLRNPPTRAQSSGASNVKTGIVSLSPSFRDALIRFSVKVRGAAPLACATAFAPPAVLAWAAAAVGDATGAAGAADEGEEAGAGAGAGDDAPPAASPLAAAPDPPSAL